MKKKLVTAFCSTLAVATALPALADHYLGGYYRVAGVTEMVKAIGQAKSAKPDTVVDERLRARWQNNFNEYLSVVWFGEVDVPWGENVTKPAGANKGLGAGGQQGADGVNVETKNAYLDFKIQDAPYAPWVRAGVQGFVDNAFSGIVMNDDLAGLTLGGRTEAMSATVGWFKLDEGIRNKEDDSDLYVAQIVVSPSSSLKLMPEVWWARNQPKKVSEFYVGAGVAYKLPMANLTGFLLYDGGTVDKVGKTEKYNISAWAASVKAAADVGGAKASLRLLYFINDGDKKDRNSFNPPNGANGGLESFDENLQIFLYDQSAMNTASGRLALTDAAYAGYGLFGAVLGGAYTPPTMKQVYVKGAVGYFQALEDKINGEATKSKKGTQLGTEISAQVGYKAAEKVDVSLRAAYAFLGNFYDKQALDASDNKTRNPDNLYKVALMVNVPY